MDRYPQALADLKELARFYRENEPPVEEMDAALLALQEAEARARAAVVEMAERQAVWGWLILFYTHFHAAIRHQSWRLFWRFPGRTRRVH